jgi:hypothetical protein
MAAGTVNIAPETRKGEDLTPAGTQVDVFIETKDQLHALLSDAEAAILPAAVKAGTSGILVTRHDSRRYSVALSDSVPFGETHELLAD